MPRIHATTSLAILAAVASLASAAPTAHAAVRTLTITSFNCESLGRKLLCQVEASGGTEPYTYAWTPTPILFGGHIANIACNYGSWRSVSVTVTDANNDSATASGSFYCGDPQ